MWRPSFTVLWERIRPLCQIGFGPVRNYLPRYFRTGTKPIWQSGLSRSTYPFPHVYNYVYICTHTHTLQKMSLPGTGPRQTRLAPTCNRAGWDFNCATAQHVGRVVGRKSYCGAWRTQRRARARRRLGPPCLSPSYLCIYIGVYVHV